MSSLGRDLHVWAAHWAGVTWVHPCWVRARPGTCMKVSFEAGCTGAPCSVGDPHWRVYPGCRVYYSGQR